MKFNSPLPILAEEMLNRGNTRHQNRLCFPRLPGGRFATFFAQAKKVMRKTMNVCISNFFQRNPPTESLGPSGNSSHRRFKSSVHHSRPDASVGTPPLRRSNDSFGESFGHSGGYGRTCLHVFILRFTDEQVLNNLLQVDEKISRWIEKKENEKVYSPCT